MLFLCDRVMRGGSVRGVLQAHGGRLTEAEAKLAGLCVLKGLRAMHAGGYAHLDIKPANVGVAQEGDLASTTLMDYGSAEPIGATAALHAEDSMTP